MQFKSKLAVMAAAMAAAAAEDLKKGRRGAPAGSGVFKVLIYVG